MRLENILTIGIGCPRLRAAGDKQPACFRAPIQLPEPNRPRIILLEKLSRNACLYNSSLAFVTIDLGTNIMPLAMPHIVTTPGQFFNGLCLLCISSILPTGWQIKVAII